MVKLKDYKGYAIVVSEGGTFLAHEKSGESGEYLGEVLAEGKTLEELTAKVDKLAKQKLGFTVWTAIHGGWKKGRVTSIREGRGYYDKAYRVRVTSGREWEDVSMEELVKDTPDNKTRIEAILATEAEIDRLKKGVEKLEGQLERHKKVDFLGA